MSQDPQENVTAFWSAIASGYEDHPGNVAAPNSAEYAAWVAVLRDALPPPPSDVLDVGTGTGFLALIAAELGHRVTGIDIAEPMLAAAREESARRKLTVQFRAGDAIDPDLQPASFDAITNRHLLWTLRDPLAAFTNWRRLLRPGGRVVSIDGFWFTDESDAPNEIFDRYYSSETRGALPLMALNDTGPIVDVFRQAGYEDVSVTSLNGVWEAAEDPPGKQPPYAIVAHAA
jgi:ubiquinone/menaquinone biosynthesis C-methylase UbiE